MQTPKPNPRLSVAVHGSDTAPHEHFDHGASWYDLFPVPTHPRALRRGLGGSRGPLVDLGGGTGKYTVRFALPEQRPTVTDPSRPMMMQAARKRRPVRLIQAIGHALPYADRSIGAITATEAFHHFIPDQDGVLAECARVLRPDGVLLIEEPDPTTFIGRLMFGAERIGQLGSIFHAPEDLARHAQRHFGDVTTRPSGWFTYLLTAREPRPA